MATGYNVVDVDEAKLRDIVVTNVPAYGTASVAQATFALLLELTNHVGYYNATVHEGQWSKSIDFCYADKPLIELSGLTMGVIGFGTIGRAVVNLATAFGMNVVVHSRTQRQASNFPKVEFADLDKLLGKSDVISLHCPLMPETHELINTQRLNQMNRRLY